MSEFHHYPEHICPRCESHLNIAMSTNPETGEDEIPPSSGDITLCGVCLKVFTFSSEGAPVPLSMKEVDALSSEDKSLVCSALRLGQAHPIHVEWQAAEAVRVYNQFVGILQEKDASPLTGLFALMRGLEATKKMLDPDDFTRLFSDWLHALNDPRFTVSVTTVLVNPDDRTSN